jgi:CHAD domain-containing protein
MKLSSTWIVVEDGRRPAGLVAARTLRKRLDTVWRTLTAAAVESPHDVENVHQLRVATRRALAAIEAFRDLLPTRRADWFAKRLRRLRHAAGEARDLDVLTDRLTGEAGSERATSARRRLVAMLSKQRESARQPIRSQHERLLDDWLDRVERLLAGIDTAPSQPTFRTYARRRFRPMMRHFFAAAERKLRSVDEMHALRIEGKKLRYAMEIFSSMFAPRIRARCYDALERLQATLGDFTDHAAAADRLRRLADEPSAAANRDVLERLRTREERQAEEARKAFVKWWDADRRRALRRRFERTLGRMSA